MDKTALTYCTAFAGERRIASGPLVEAAFEGKGVVDRGETGRSSFSTTRPADRSKSIRAEPVNRSRPGRQRQHRRRQRPDGGTPASAPDAGLEDSAPRGPGRPKLGVVAREVTLLPRHWEWLGTQPGGASVH